MPQTKRFSKHQALVGPAAAWWQSSADSLKAVAEWRAPLGSKVQPGRDPAKAVERSRACTRYPRGEPGAHRAAHQIPPGVKAADGTPPVIKRRHADPRAAAWSISEAGPSQTTQRQGDE